MLLSIIPSALLNRATRLSKQAEPGQAESHRLFAHLKLFCKLGDRFFSSYVLCEPTRACNLG